MSALILRASLALRCAGRNACAGMLLMAVSALALGQSAAPPAAPAAAPLAQTLAAADANAWLSRIQQAAASRSYQGTLLFSAGGALSSAKVVHICDGRQRYERIELLDGQARLQYRHNDQMLTLWPSTRLARLEQRDPVAEFPALPVAAPQRALDSYELQVLNKDRVAGHEAEVLLLKPRDKLRFAQRLWADRDTGLLLRNDVLGAAGEVLESSFFTDIAIGGKPSPDSVLGPMRKLAGYRVARPQVARAQMDAEGWALTRPVPGFQLISCTKRPLDALAEPDAPLQVLQSVFSDGLTHVSVFIEPFDASRHKQALGTSMGATHTLTNRHGDWWLTVVGEVPMATAQQFDAMFERKR